MFIVVGDDDELADGAAGLAGLPPSGGLGDESRNGLVAIRDLDVLTRLQRRDQIAQSGSRLIDRDSRHVAPLATSDHSLREFLLSPAQSLG
jgi:hypothetical protein